jgi:hypothetical protein
MVDTTDIEKKSLEAHVELCAERYRYLEEKLDSLEARLLKITCMIADIKSMVNSSKQTQRSNNQLGFGYYCCTRWSNRLVHNNYVIK